MPATDHLTALEATFLDVVPIVALAAGIRDELVELAFLANQE